MPNLQRVITKKRETALHISAEANKEDFAKNLVKRMTSYDLQFENAAGNTALTYAAATGNVNIAKAMLDKNKDLSNLEGGMKPLFMAASLVHSQMVDHLSLSTRIQQWDKTEQIELFVTYASVGLYGKRKLYVIFFFFFFSRFDFLILELIQNINHGVNILNAMTS